MAWWISLPLALLTFRIRGPVWVPAALLSRLPAKTLEEAAEGDFNACALNPCERPGGGSSSSRETSVSVEILFRVLLKQQPWDNCALLRTS